MKCAYSRHGEYHKQNIQLARSRHLKHLSENAMRYRASRKSTEFCLNSLYKIQEGGDIIF